MRRKNWRWITEYQVFLPVEDSFLAFREIIQAQKTWPFFYIFFYHTGKTAFNSTGIVLDADGKSSAGDFPLPDML